MEIKDHDEKINKTVRKLSEALSMEFLDVVFNPILSLYQNNNIPYNDKKDNDNNVCMNAKNLQKNLETLKIDWLLCAIPIHSNSVQEEKQEGQEKQKNLISDEYVEQLLLELKERESLQKSIKVKNNGFVSRKRIVSTTITATTTAATTTDNTTTDILFPLWWISFLGSTNDLAENWKNILQTEKYYTFLNFDKHTPNIEKETKKITTKNKNKNNIATGKHKNKNKNKIKNKDKNKMNENEKLKLSFPFFSGHILLPTFSNLSTNHDDKHSNYLPFFTLNLLQNESKSKFKFNSHIFVTSILNKFQFLPTDQIDKKVSNLESEISIKWLNTSYNIPLLKNVNLLQNNQNRNNEQEKNDTSSDKNDNDNDSTKTTKLKIIKSQSRCSICYYSIFCDLEVHILQRHKENKKQKKIPTFNFLFVRIPVNVIQRWIISRIEERQIATRLRTLDYLYNQNLQSRELLHRLYRIWIKQGGIWNLFKINDREVIREISQNQVLIVQNLVFYKDIKQWCSEGNIFVCEFWVLTPETTNNTIDYDYELPTSTTICTRIKRKLIFEGCGQEGKEKQIKNEKILKRNVIVNCLSVPLYFLKQIFCFFLFSFHKMNYFYTTKNNKNNNNNNNNNNSHNKKQTELLFPFLGQHVGGLITIKEAKQLITSRKIFKKEDNHTKQRLYRTNTKDGFQIKKNNIVTKRKEELILICISDLCWFMENKIQIEKEDRPTQILIVCGSFVICSLFFIMGWIFHEKCSKQLSLYFSQ